MPKYVFAEAGIALHLTNSAARLTDIQWMVKEGYGLALVDQLSPLDTGLITRPIARVHWDRRYGFRTCRSEYVVR